MTGDNYVLALIPGLPLIGAFINLMFGRWLSRKAVHFVAITAVAAAFGVAAWLIADPLWSAYKVWKSGGGAVIPELTYNAFTWIEVGSFKIDMAFRIDTLTAVMLMVITFVGTLIHIYSTGYMSEEPRYAAYFGYLNLFTGMMLILVMGSSLPIMFIGWEGVGLCSYLLIGFWFTNPDYASAGRKAFVVNRIGDFAFLIGMFLLYWATKDLGFDSGLDFGDLRTDAAQATYTQGFWAGERLAMWAGLFLFIGACGKSAQIPLYVWLPDAMAGPTPVSALIHAATMVTAGVYMIARLGFLYASSTTAMAIVAGVGALTALLAALMAFAQTDLKKVLAYSTVSQLGFMFVAVGVGAHVAGIFHLVTHAFFKAGLFLAAGSVMHAMSGSGDILKMGGLRKKLPLTHISFAIYCLAIAGIVPFSGFFSKDEILLGAFLGEGQGWPSFYGELLWVTLSIAALCTAFYMWRLYFLVFSGECRADAETKAHIHESPSSMTSPLLILAGFSCVLGLIGLPHFSFLKLNLLGDWLAPSIKTGLGGHAGDGTIAGLMALALAIGLAGIFIARALYKDGPSAKVAAATESGAGHTAYLLSKNKFYVDEIYEKLILGPFRWLATALFEFVDRFVIDLIFVNGSALVVKAIGQLPRLVQNGQVQRYMFGVVVGAVAIFYLTGRTQADFNYELTAPTKVMFTAEVGAGPAGHGATVRWDFNGDGQPDKSVDQATGKDVYVEGNSQELTTGEVGDKVTVWITDKVFGKTRTVTKRIKLPAAGAALPAPETEGGAL